MRYDLRVTVIFALSNSSFPLKITYVAPEKINRSLAKLIPCDMSQITPGSHELKPTRTVRRMSTRRIVTLLNWTVA